MKKRILVSQVIAVIVIILADPASWKLFAAGVSVMALGQLIRLLASSAIVKSKALTVSGPYSVVRNPLYLGTAIMVLGLLITLSNPQSPLRTALAWLIMTGSFTFIYRVQIKAEEEFLLSVYGAEFERYKLRVNAILPRFGTLPGFLDAGACSREVFRKNKEWRGVFGMVALTAIVAARIHCGF